MLRISVVSFALLSAVLAMAGTPAAPCPTGFFQETFWSDGTGDWSNAANWSAGVPNSNVEAEIDNGGTAQVTGPGAAALDVDLGFNTASDSGKVAVDGNGRLSVGLVLGVGVNGNGTLIVTNSGVVSATGAGIGNGCTIGAQAASTGAVTVDGKGSILAIASELHVGFFGVGVINITDGGAVSSQVAFVADRPGSQGTVTVDGAGSTWTNNSNGFVWFIGDAGTGTLAITNGGTVSFNTQATIGESPDSQGDVTVDGADSTWNPGSIMVGDFGTGSLHVTNGGTLSSMSLSWIGFEPGSTGEVTIDGTGSTWIHNGDLAIGTSGRASLNITNGGALSVSSGFAAIGAQSGSQGTVTVEGPGSSLTNSGGHLFVGGSPLGAGGTGLLRLDSGGTVSAANMTVYGPGTVTGSGLVETDSGTTIEGTLAPIQRISFNGNLVFSGTGAMMLSNVTPETADNIIVKGTAALDQHLVVTLTGGPFKVGTQYALLQAGGGLNGTTFSNVSFNYPTGQGFHPEIRYDSDHVYLSIEPGEPTPTPTPTPTATPRLTPTPRPRPTPRIRPTLLH